jgi:hypothetical protein
VNWPRSISAVDIEAVYDLTSFASDHPGGIDVLKDCAGTDGTEPYEYAGHSEGAISTLQRFQVGVLEGHPDAANRPSAPNIGGIIPKMVKAKDSLQSRAHRISWRWTPLWSGTSCAVFALLLVALAMNRRPVGVDGGATRLYGFVEGIHPDWIGLVSAFISGLALALVCGFATMAGLYAQFNRTLRHEKEVFDYPSVIPVRR